MIRILLITALITSFARAEFPRPGIPFNPRNYLCQRASGEITVDGRLDDPVWSRARWTAVFQDIEGSLQPAPYLDTRLRMLWDDQALYIGADLEEPDLWSTLTERDAVIFHDNDFEVFIDPDGDTHEYYELEVNTLGTVWDLLLLAPYRDRDRVAVDSWDIAGLQCAVHCDGTVNDPSDRDTGWQVEIALPWQVLEECADRAVPVPGDTWRINFSRVQWDLEVVDGTYRKLDRPEHNWVWSPQGLIAMHYPEMWGYLQFTDQPDTQFIRPLYEDVRWQLRQLYYDQKDYRESHGYWAQTIQELKQAGSHLLAGGQEIRLIPTLAGWEADVALSDSKSRMLIDYEGCIREIANSEGDSQ